ncbi:MAG: hypothetical protein QOK26_1898 [Pseudonocardiales bacterium]|jgi:hypothetical protein|nr:hypothetical protein [Pseudonocardiales bacterium]
MPLRLGIVGLGAVAQLVYEPILDRRRDLSRSSGSPAAGHAHSELLRARALGGAAATLGWVYSDVLLGSLIHDLVVLRQ